MRKSPTPKPLYRPVHFVWPVLDGSGLRLTVSCETHPRDWCRRGSGSCHYLSAVTWIEDATAMTECDYVGMPCVPRIGPIDFVPIGENDSGNVRYAWFYRESGVVQGCGECRMSGGHSREGIRRRKSLCHFGSARTTAIALSCRCWDFGVCEPCCTDILSWQADCSRASRLKMAVHGR